MACKRPGVRVPLAPRFRRSKVCCDLENRFGALATQQVARAVVACPAEIYAGQNDAARLYRLLRLLDSQTSSLSGNQWGSCLDRPGDLGGSDPREDAESCQHSESTPRSCASAWSDGVREGREGPGEIARVGGSWVFTLRRCADVQQAEIDGGTRPGITTEDSRRTAELERENCQLWRPNEILKAASAYFVRDSTPGCRASRVHRFTS
jgi:hypothetical protein